MAASAVMIGGAMVPIALEGVKAVIGRIKSGDFDDDPQALQKAAGLVAQVANMGAVHNMELVKYFHTAFHAGEDASQARFLLFVEHLNTTGLPQSLRDTLVLEEQRIRGHLRVQEGENRKEVVKEGIKWTAILALPLAVASAMLVWDHGKKRSFLDKIIG
jgi:hypothetical protein